MNNSLTLNGLFDYQDRIPSGMGSSKKGTVEKNAHFYHVIQSTFNKEEYFGNFDVAMYRQNILKEQCIKNGIVLVFSVTMPNHTHDVFLTKSWDALSKALCYVNRSVVKYIKKRYNSTHKRDFDQMGKRVFAERPVYIPIHSVVQLFYLAKYIYDNPLVQGLDLNHTISSFWTFKHEALKPPYNPKLYEVLFGMTAKELTSLCEQMDKNAFMDYAQNRFGCMPKEQQDALMKIDPSLPWSSEEFVLPED